MKAESTSGGSVQLTYCCAHGLCGTHRCSMHLPAKKHSCSTHCGLISTPQCLRRQPAIDRAGPKDPVLTDQTTWEELTSRPGPTTISPAAQTERLLASAMCFVPHSRSFA